jgi:hypothetical protein
MSASSCFVSIWWGSRGVFCCQVQEGELPMSPTQRIGELAGYSKAEWWPEDTSCSCGRGKPWPRRQSKCKDNDYDITPAVCNALLSWPYRVVLGMKHITGCGI